MRLKDKVAIVTGAASGIGKEIAKTFVREGARVVIADLNQKAADAAAGELGDTRKALGLVMDVTNEQQVEAGVARTVEQFGKIDVLVSNAGIQIVAIWMVRFSPPAPCCSACTSRAPAEALSIWDRCTRRRHRF